MQLPVFPAPPHRRHATLLLVSLALPHIRFATLLLGFEEVHVRVYKTFVVDGTPAALVFFPFFFDNWWMLNVGIIT